MTQEFDPRHIVEVLDRHGVLYVLIGGYAAQLYGARRPTNHLDIAPSNQLENLDRLAHALHELDAGIRVDGSDTGLPFSCTAESLRGMHTLNLRTSAGDLDLTFAPAGFGNGYTDLEPNAVAAVIDRPQSKSPASMMSSSPNQSRHDPKTSTHRPNSCG